MFTEQAFPIPKRGEMISHDHAMALAIQEAAKGAPRVSPNPMVGAVVVDSRGGFLASGYHEYYGGPHAEVNALKDLSQNDLQGAAVYVTLEPCAHEGKTQSCAKMMARLPLKKVYYGLVDPNPLVSGEGAEILKKAGITTELFHADNHAKQIEFEVMLEESCEAFLWNFRQKKVFVALKMASSLDGQVALKSGESQWITGPQSRESVHYLRACYDGVLVGNGTVRFDNPSLDVRHSSIKKTNNVIVLDPEAEILKGLEDLKLSKTHAASEIILCVSIEFQSMVQSILKSLARPPHVIFIESDVSGDFKLESILDQLYKLGLRSIMIEGGALTASHFLQAGLVNRLYLYQAPILMGSGGSRSWTETIRIGQMSEKIFLKNPRYFRFGPDIMVTGKL